MGDRADRDNNDTTGDNDPITMDDIMEENSSHLSETAKGIDEYMAPGGEHGAMISNTVDEKQTDDEEEKESGDDEEPEEAVEAGEGGQDDGSGVGTESYLAHNAKVKALIDPYSKVFRNKSSTLRSIVWTGNHFKSWRIFNEDDKEKYAANVEIIRSLDPTVLDKLGNKTCYICCLCYKDPQRSLSQCLFKAAQNTVTNLHKHLKSHYTDWDNRLGTKLSAANAKVVSTPGSAAKETVRSSASTQEKTQSKRALFTDHDASHDASSLSNVSERPSTKKKKRTIVHAKNTGLGPSEVAKDPFSSFQEVGEKKTKERAKHCLLDLHNYIFKYTAMNNVPHRSVARPHLRPEFRDMIAFAVKNGSLLSKFYKPQDYVMGQEQLTDYVMTTYSKIIAAVKVYVSESRLEYNRLAGGIPVGFINIGHDIWDSKKVEILGVALFFYNPIRGKVHHVVAGLDLSWGKASKDTASQCLSILKPYGIEIEDLHRPVNDTTNAALKTGRLLAGGPSGTCCMHESQLVVDYAVAKRVKKKNKKNVDDFEDCRKLLKKSLGAATYLMNRKKKQRFRQYQQFGKRTGRDSIRLKTPNATRSAGIILHLESMLRSRWLLDHYWRERDDDEVPQEHQLKNEDWIQLSQIEGLLQPMRWILFNVQTDRPGALSYTFIGLYRAYTHYVCATTYWHANVDKTVSREETRWKATAVFHERSVRGNPLVKPPPDTPNDIAGTATHVGMTKTEKKDLRDIPKKIIPRLVAQMTKRAAKPTTDRLIAMACNPFTATTGMTLLTSFSKGLTNHTKDESVLETIVDFRSAAIEALVTRIKEVLGPELTSEALEETEGEVEQKVPDDDDYMLEMYEAAQQESETQTGEDCKVKSQVEAFFKQEFDPLVRIQNQRQQTVIDIDLQSKIGKNSSDWLRTFFVIAQEFDVMEWWEVIGKAKFPLIYVVATCILSLPDSNGFLERAFSTGNWMDAKLSQSMKDSTFKMKVHLQKNMHLLDGFDFDNAREQFLESKFEATKMMHRDDSEVPPATASEDMEEGIGSDDDNVDILAVYDEEDDDSD